MRMKQKVRILTSQKTDGRYNTGVIIGIEYTEGYYYLGYNNLREYVTRHDVPRYKVAYVDCVTQRAQNEWYYQNQLEALR